MAVGGGGVSALFYNPPITPGDVASWFASGVLQDGGAGGGGGMSIGGTVTGGTAGSVLFINPNTILAQDNANFFWDDTNFNLSIDGSGTGQGILKIGGQNAIYRVPNASGDNWFEAGAGNLTLTGNSNFGTGTSCLTNLTTGLLNTAIGANALQSLTTGQQNLALGSQALQTVTSGNSNVAIGTAALNSLTTGNNNFAIGTFALIDLLNGSGNTAIGVQALSRLSTTSNNVAVGGGGLLHALGSGNTGVGTNILTNIATGNNNTAVGLNTGQLMQSGDNNVLIGDQVFPNITSSYGQLNTVIGSAAATLLTSSNFNTLIGTWQGQGAVPSVSEVIAFSDGLSGFNGRPHANLDWNYVTGNVWSINTVDSHTQGLHIYNVQDSTNTNYERAVFDWNISANVLTIGTQASGTGTVRNTSFIGGTFSFPAASILESTSTVAGLPAAGTAGRRAVVTDATVFTFGTIVIGGGTDTVPVYDDGTNWRIG